MQKAYTNIKAKIEKLQSAGASEVTINFYKTVLMLCGHVIVLTRSSGVSFPLIFQSQGPQSVKFSYKNFKNYQRKTRLLFFLLATLLVILVKTQF
ncbi:MAG: hypothetical protein AAB487_01310 [Patescibacteria group bacterium]